MGRPIVEKISSGTEFEPQLSDFVTLCLCDTIGFYKATNDLPADVVQFNILLNIQSDRMKSYLYVIILQTGDINR